METGKGESADPGGDRRETAGQSRRWLFLRRDPEFLDAIRRLYDPPNRLIDPYVKQGQVAADLGCGSGYVTFPLADLVGPEGKVYAVDLDDRCIRRIQEKAKKRGYRNIEAHASSATDLGFIADRSLDFVLANGLLCSMAHDRPLAVKEIKRILKSNGQAFLSLGFPPPLGFVGEAEWTQTLEAFKVKDGGSFKQRWALVSLKEGTG